jgi:hypothetical protein
MVRGKKQEIFRRWLFWFTLIGFVGGIIFRNLDRLGVAWGNSISTVFWAYFDIAFVLVFALLAILFFLKADRGNVDIPKDKYGKEINSIKNAIAQIDMKLDVVNSKVYRQEGSIMLKDKWQFIGVWKSFQGSEKYEGTIPNWIKKKIPTILGSIGNTYQRQLDRIKDPKERMVFMSQPFSDIQYIRDKYYSYKLVFAKGDETDSLIVYRKPILSTKNR